jgi:hypothetical protein
LRNQPLLPMPKPIGEVREMLVASHGSVAYHSHTMERIPAHCGKTKRRD